MKKEPPSIKKFKAPFKLDDKPVYILADNVEAAKLILAAELAHMGNPCVEKGAFKLKQVEYNLK